MKQLFKFSFLTLIFFACNKSSINNLESEQATIVSKSLQPPSPSVIDPERKWGERICGDSSHLGTACDIVGSTCKKHECNAGTQKSITKFLSEMEIADYAKKYADEQVEHGYIQKEDEEITIAIMKSALKVNNKKFR